MSDEVIMDLLQIAPLSFVGTIEHLGAATMDVPIDDRTAVVYVDRVLHGPGTLLGLAGQRITLQLAAAADPSRVGDTAAFFGQVLAMGGGVTVAEVGRLAVEDVVPHLQLAADAGGAPFAELERRVEVGSLCEHATQADAVVLGIVVKLERVAPQGDARFSEHDPDWWVATLFVDHVERGDVAPGEVEVLYANSLDVRWREAPKPKASERGLWLLHRTNGAMAGVARFEISDVEDRQPVESLDTFREYWS